MHTSSRWAAIAAAAAGGLLAAGCGGSTPSTPAAATPAPTPIVAPVVLTATATVAGKSETILTDAKGMTLYYYGPDKGGKVTCTSACAQNWPPLMLPAGVTTPAGDKGVTGMLGTAVDPDGGAVVTYNGWPLYTWTRDKMPGDTTGQGVAGKWAAATPDIPSAT